MYLQRLEVQGFKSFAKKTVLEFLPPRPDRKSITAVVGPNGSGKSNSAEAIRWVLGEQSLKLLRGKKAEDVIFMGSDKKAQLGFAEASLYLINEDSRPPVQGIEIEPIDFPEIVITRRLYRDGESEYLINGARSRLSDIQLLLAKAHFGQKTYTVIGQGMIDHMLVSSAKERKEFFDEAAGVKEFQMKRHQAMLKLHATKENIAQAELLLNEIEPRVRSLGRAVKRLEERGKVEERLRELQRSYYGSLWHEVAEKRTTAEREIAAKETELKEAQTHYNSAMQEMCEMEASETSSEALIGLQRQYERATEERQKLSQEILQIKTADEVRRARAEAAEQWSPLPLTQIISSLEEVRADHERVRVGLRTAKTLEAAREFFDAVDVMHEKTVGLIKRLQRPAPEERTHAESDPAVDARIEEIQKSLVLIESAMKRLGDEMHAESHREQENKSSFFAVQRRLQERQQRVHGIEQALGSAKIEFAKHDTRAETLHEEMLLEIPDLIQEITHAKSADAFSRPESFDQAQRELYQLKHQLELIGGIDSGVMKEYEETNERFIFLDAQLSDLRVALGRTEKTIVEFDELLKIRREDALRDLNMRFQEFFALLFRGGTAKLVPLYGNPYEAEIKSTDNESESEAEAAEENSQAEMSREPTLLGIEIIANPPGKRVRDISILSGGERAMTSVALLCAILANNPSPFVVLDEVDAALDEANSGRFADIIEKLSEKTQFILITHNRATMSKADILYGVTMGDDGVSQLLSVKFDEATRWAKAA